jgi:hypothetical protein
MNRPVLPRGCSVLLIAVILLGGLASCQHSSELAAPPSQPRKPLVERIPKADPAKYQNVRYGGDWKNPSLAIDYSGVWITSPQLPGGPRKISSDQVLSVLDNLPDAAWPYGRIVAASESGVLPVIKGAESAEQQRRLRESLLRLKQQLEAHGIAVDPWPSA